MTRTCYRYDHVAWCYEWIARVYSLGAIPRAKASQISQLKAGQRVLYVGVGAGEDALLAARAGADLTCIDLSPAMLARLRKRLEGEGLRAELIEADILDYVAAEPYDAVVANFVLNVFCGVAKAQVMKHLVSLLGQDGVLMIADFAPPRRGWLERGLFALYYRPINVAAWLLRLCALHPIYDYAAEFESLGLRALSRTSTPVWSGAREIIGPRFFESLVARRFAD